MIERILTCLLPHKVIVNCERDPYLVRWYLLRTSWVAIFIHKFIRSDEDRALHDHPWNFIVIPIWRGYIEHSVCRSCKGEVCQRTSKRRVWPIIGARFRRSTYRHRVELFKRWEKIHNSAAQLESEAEYISGELPSWSLFIRFTEHRTWGFWLKDGFMAWNRWWQEKCE